MPANFNPQKDIPDLADKVCLVTGASSGLGEAAVAAIAEHNPRKVYLGARSRTRAEEALDRIRATSQAAKVANIEILELDVASFDSVKKAAAYINQDTDRLDVVQLNAGLSNPVAAVTKEGYELTFGTNYVGHVLLTQLLLPKLLATSQIPGADVRVVVLSSIAHRQFPPKGGILFDEVKTDMRNYTGGRTTGYPYAQSNVARTLFAYEFAKRYPNIKISSLHPGVVYTNIWSGISNFNSILHGLLIWGVRLMGATVSTGVKNQLWCSFSPEVESGAYYEPIGKRVNGKYTRDDSLAKTLWDWTDQELTSHGAPGWPAATGTATATATA